MTIVYIFVPINVVNVENVTDVINVKDPKGLAIGSVLILEKRKTI